VIYTYGEDGLVLVTPKEDADIIGPCSRRVYAFTANEARYVDRRDWESTLRETGVLVEANGS
jgi:hypothetical protein